MLDTLVVIKSKQEILAAMPFKDIKIKFVLVSSRGLQTCLQIYC